VSIATAVPSEPSRALPARAGLALVGAAQAEIGVWGLVDPRSFFAQYPGAGHHWLTALGPYNEHLVRDFAAMELGFALLLATAAMWFDRRLVVIAGTVFLIATIPHFIYHLTTTSSFSTSDDLASLGGFVLELVLVATAMLIATRGREGTG
jgi:hypothetical protein